MAAAATPLRTGVGAALRAMRALQCACGTIVGAPAPLAAAAAPPSCQAAYSAALGLRGWAATRAAASATGWRASPARAVAAPPSQLQGLLGPIGGVSQLLLLRHPQQHRCYASRSASSSSSGGSGGSSRASSSGGGGGGGSSGADRRRRGSHAADYRQHSLQGAASPLLPTSPAAAAATITASSSSSGAGPSQNHTTPATPTSASASTAAGGGGREADAGGGGGVRRAGAGRSPPKPAAPSASPPPPSSSPAAAPTTTTASSGQAPPLQPLRVQELVARGHVRYTLREYRLPPLAAPRSPAEQRALEAALAVVRRLRRHGFTGLLAGGWVRDQLLGRPAADIDLATNATFVQVFDVFGTRACRLKGGYTCDVTVDGCTLELTTYRGHLTADSPEAEWRDAAARDFTLNALFFDPHLPPDPDDPAAAAAAAASRSNNSSGGGRGGGRKSDGGAAAAAAASSSTSPLAPPPGQQPPGVVRDYVGAVTDLARRTLRVYSEHGVMGVQHSSVEMDPVRVLRAARLQVQLGLGLDGYTEERVRLAARKCTLGAHGVTASRVYRELCKMAALDADHTAQPPPPQPTATPATAETATTAAATTAPAAAAAAAGSVRFAEALRLCQRWRVLHALLPDLPKDYLDRVLAEVFPRLPPHLPTDLKLCCLAVGVRQGDLWPLQSAAAYEPIRKLLAASRLSGGLHWPDLLADLARLLPLASPPPPPPQTAAAAAAATGSASAAAAWAESRASAHAEAAEHAAWARLLAHEDFGHVQAALEAFVAPRHVDAFRSLLDAKRAPVWAQLKRQQQQRQQQQQAQQGYRQNQQQQQQAYRQQQQQQQWPKRAPQVQAAAAAAAASGGGGGGGGGGGRLGGGVSVSASGGGGGGTGP